MFMLDVKEGANHSLKFIIRVESAHGIVREMGDEISALALNNLFLILWRSVNDAAVEVARGYGDVCAGRFKVAHGPFVIRSDKNGFHLSIFADFAANKVQGFRRGHRVKDMVESVVFRLFGGLDILKEFVFIDGFDERIKVNKNEVLVGYEFLREFGALGERWDANDVFLLRLGGFIGCRGCATKPTGFLRTF